MLPNLRRLLLWFLIALALLRAGQTVAAALPLGLPGLLGGDYVAYYTAGTLVLRGEVHHLYDLDGQRQVQQAVETKAGVPAAQQFTMAFDNPPPAALLLAPLALLPPGWSFVLWTGLNVALCLAALGLVAPTWGRGGEVREGGLRHRRFLGNASRAARGDGAGRTRRSQGGASPATEDQADGRGSLAPLLLFYPVLLGLFYGQMIGPVLLLYALAVRWLADGAEARAGAALAVLAAVKPQYALVLLLFVALKGRWRAVAAAALVGGALLALSAALVGPAGLLGYERELAQLDPYAGDPSYMIDPNVMINWRAVLLTFAPALSPRAGFLLTNLFALATIVVAAVAWRGPWRPTAPAFGWQVLAATAATLLASYHSHAHGAVLLLVPYLLLAQAPGGLTVGGRRLATLAYWPPLVLLALAGPAVLALRAPLSLLLIGCLLAALALSLRASLATATPNHELAPAALGATP